MTFPHLWSHNRRLECGKLSLRASLMANHYNVGVDAMGLSLFQFALDGRQFAPTIAGRRGVAAFR